jgi:glycosyltransferase involved in cell wall biosynthesis
MPARNAEATITQAIASTLGQSYPDFELWVLENGSTDRTAAVARSFSDPRIRVFELGPVGFQGALQYALDRASSDWLARMDADDLMFPDRLEAQMDIIRRSPELVLVGTEFALLTPFGHIFERVRGRPSRHVDTRSLCWNRFFADPSTIFRRRVALEVGGYDPEFTMGDVPLWFRILTRGTGWEIAAPLHVYRLQPNSMNRANGFYREALRARAKYAPQTVDRCPRPPDSEFGWWYSIAKLELLAGDGVAVRRATDVLAHEAPTTARRLRWLSYFGRAGHLCYRWRDRSGPRYRHRADWERLFAPMLGNE